MIQELLSSEARKLSFPNGGFLSDATSPFLSSNAGSTSLSPASSSCILQPSSSQSPSTTAESSQQKLRCPRCDSPNTKFCYYNNYNLTQPRHFCKTCRRYWTKGGALRNVPIGGGCRKAKPALIMATGGGVKSCNGSKPNTIPRSGFGFESELFQPGQILRTGPPAASSAQLFTLLRTGSENLDPFPFRGHNSVRIKEEDSIVDLNGRNLDAFNHFSCSAGMDPLWRNEGQLPYLHHQDNAGYQDLYHRLRIQEATTSAMAEAYRSEQISNMSNGWSAHGCSSLANGVGSGAGSSSTAVATVEAAMGGEFGYWNPALSWSDMSTTN